MSEDNEAGLTDVYKRGQLGCIPASTLPNVPNKPKTKGTPFRIPEHLKTAAQEAAAADERYNGNLSAVVRDKLAEYVAERNSRK